MLIICILKLINKIKDKTMKKIIQKVIDENKGNISFVGTDSIGQTVIVDNNNIIIESFYTGLNSWVSYENGKIKIYKD